MIISWNITRACQLKCRHCYRDAGRKEADELSTSEGLDLIDEIAKAGFKILILSGGEPLLRSDVFDLIAHARALGLRPVLGTNGVLITRGVARRLKDAGLARAGISLDSTDEAVHDDFRQENGAWQGSLAGMRACREEGLEFQVHTTVTRFNDRNVLSITDLAVSEGARAHHIFFLVPTGRGKDLAVISSERYNSLLREVLKKQRTAPIELKPVCAPQFIPLAQEMGLPLRFQRGCLAGISYCCILPNGEVHPCPYFPVSAGNVRMTRFSEMWANHTLFRELRAADYEGACGTCCHKTSCGGCRARAYAATGSYMEFDSECVFESKVQEC